MLLARDTDETNPFSNVVYNTFSFIFFWIDNLVSNWKPVWNLIRKQNNSQWKLCMYWTIRVQLTKLCKETNMNIDFTNLEERKVKWWKCCPFMPVVRYPPESQCNFLISLTYEDGKIKKFEIFRSLLDAIGYESHWVTIKPLLFP